MNVQNQQPVTFDDWFASEQNKGLIDIKFAITEQRNSSVQSLQEEILAIEALVEIGVVKEFKKPTAFVRDDIDQLFYNIVL